MYVSLVAAQGYSFMHSLTRSFIYIDLQSSMQGIKILLREPLVRGDV